MDHPCGRWTCPEWHGGQCFGGGCELHPAPEREDGGKDGGDGEEDDDETSD